MQYSLTAGRQEPRGHIGVSESRVSRDRYGGKSRTGRCRSPRQSATLQRARHHRTDLTRSPVSSRNPPGRRPSGHCVEAGVDSNSNEEILDHVIVAIDIGDKDRVGCACYVASEEKLLCMEEIGGPGSNDIVEKCKYTWPTHFLLSCRADSISSSAHAQLGQADSLTHSDDQNQPLPYQVNVRPASDFAFGSSIDKLLSLSCVVRGRHRSLFLAPGDAQSLDEAIDPQDLGMTSRKGILLQLSSWLDLSNTISIGCAGAVISHLQRKRHTETVSNGPNAVPIGRVSSLEMFSLKGTMMVNTDTLMSLQIIQPETHPNTFNQGPGASGSKESLSLFGLFQPHARCPQGKAELRRVFLRPSLDSHEITDRLNFTSVFIRPENQASCATLSKSLSKVKNMRTVMALLHKGVDGGKQSQNVFTGGVWASLLAFTYHTIDIADALGEVLGTSQLPLVVQALTVLDRVRLHRIGKMVHDVVDLEGSADQHRTVVKHGVNDQLDEIKSIYDSMEDILSMKAIEIARAIPPELNPPLNVVYFPHLGFHLTVPRDSATGKPVYSGDELGWKQMFTTPAQAYFKDHNMVEMDHDLGDLYAAICDLEIEISYGLAQTVLEDEMLLVTISDLCGKLDCLLALTQVAIQYRLTRPVLVDENVIEIKGGRHLLHELAVPSFVPNDTLLRGGSGDEEHDQGPEKGPNMILLTGPNYSGKSVYQKQVALTVYMAQVGSFVPAEAAMLGITDKIFTRITTRESVSRMQSAFMIDMQQMAIALNSCTHRTLVVIDELGKGTDSCDGVGLAVGVLNHIQALGSAMPKAIMATHFHEIFDMDCLGAMEHLSPMQMEVRVHGGRTRDDVHTPETAAAKNTDQHDSEVTYLYNLRPGRSVVSYGIQCAAMNGISPEVVERACQLVRLAQGGEDLVLTCSALSPSEERELELAEDAARQFLAWDLEAQGERKHGAMVSMVEELLGIVNEEASNTNGTSPNSRLGP